MDAGRAAVSQVLRQHGRWLVTCHVLPDADAIGASVAAVWLLRALGHQARGVLPSPAPENVTFQDPHGYLAAFDPQAGETMDEIDAVLVVDTGVPDRIGDLWPIIRARGLPVACIDHHTDDSNGLFAPVWRDTGMAACGEMLTTLVEDDFGLSLEPWLATSLYAALMFDTGNLRYRNTSPAALRCAARLVERGAVPSEIYDVMYQQRSPRQLRLYGLALNCLRMLDDDQLVMVSITGEMMREAGARSQDCHGVIELLRSLKQPRLHALLVEHEDGTIKAGLRCHPPFQVDRVARRFGGGGHPRAAGCSFDCAMDQAQATLLQALRDELREYGEQP